LPVFVQSRDIEKTVNVKLLCSKAMYFALSDEIIEYNSLVDFMKKFSSSATHQLPLSFFVLISSIIPYQ